MIHTWRGGPFFPPYQAFRHVAMAEGCRSSTTPLFIGHRHLYWLHSLCGCLCVHISPRCCPLLFSVKNLRRDFHHDTTSDWKCHLMSSQEETGKTWWFTGKSWLLWAVTSAHHVNSYDSSIRQKNLGEHLISIVISLTLAQQHPLQTLVYGWTSLLWGLIQKTVWK